MDNNIDKILISVAAIDGIIHPNEKKYLLKELSIDIDDSKADDEGGKPEGFDDIPDDLKENLKKRAGIIK